MVPKLKIIKFLLFILIFLILPGIFVGRIVDSFELRYEILPFGGFFHLIALAKFYRPNYDLILYNLLFLIPSLVISYFITNWIFNYFKTE